MSADNHGNHRFLFGLTLGTLVGTGVAILLVPRAASELRERVSNSARALRTRTSKRCEQAGASVSAAVDDLSKKGREVRDSMADAVARGAHEVERVAKAAKSH